MTSNDTFGRTLSRWLHDEAEQPLPDHLAEVLVQTAATRQRPWWSSPERWLPVQATTLRLTSYPRFAWLLVLVALLAAVGAAILLAGSRPRLPDPYGLARNGSIVYGALDGDIRALDPAAGTSTAVVGGPTNDLAPAFSPDGTRFVFAREADVARQYRLVVANADGTGLRTLTEPLVNTTWFAWSPDGTRLAVVSELEGEPALWILDIASTHTQVLDIGMAAEAVQWRPDGRELVIRGVTSGPVGQTYGLYVVGTDGTGPRAILPATDNGDHWQHPALSPDGNSIIYTQWEPDLGGRLWVVRIDEGKAKRLQFDGPLASDYYASWSADGAQIVFHRWSGDVYHLAVAPAGGGHAVEIGPAMPQSGGAATAEFSPDATRVIARYAPDGSTWLLDVTGGPGQRLPASALFLGSWQRLAR